MDDKRKKIILKEITFWKQNKMLPEHYCNYLIALYTEGEEQLQEKMIKRKKHLNMEIFFSFLFLSMIGISIVITYITDVSFGMQTLFLSFFFFLLIISFFIFRKNKKNLLLIFITGAFLFLLYSVQINDTYFSSNKKSLYILILVNCVTWLLGGLWRRQLFFIIAGTIAVGTLIIFMFIW
ncbi:hypothetical protein ACFFF5_00945 [Lederbergia wuyishanensis]|uniref:DUF2157 domain-containing protein n=1 Tax=Lederbergia wuyishanensis TaxID=1347903 RepID=A0ABU0D1G5_9BACI|nr:hypothetical protein [Lederbergia wuyishanensis]MCJ8006856.1 hypothetical protein [Lederbergia wuyishanensis]MDQ0342240.1 hypothetical protein [Lederbergia wuyishanensis]